MFTVVKFEDIESGLKQEQCDGYKLCFVDRIPETFVLE